MTVPAKAAVADPVEVLIKTKWRQCQVIDVWYWLDWSGDRQPTYRVRFADGKETLCGNNSIRRLT